MSSLTQIETAIDRLPLAEQEELLRHLARRVHRQRHSTEPQLREQWMDRLTSLRASIDSGARTITTEQILTESRQERN